MNRPFARALLASAAIAAAIALAGCDADSITPTGRAQAPISEKTLAEIAAKNMDKESPILARIFKEEAELEIWKKNRNGEYALLKTFPICRWSGDLGPKKKEGDRQAPEGFYTITPGQMNPNSNYYLAFNTGFPNAYDRAMGYTGSELMVHGDCSSRGCYAMTDEQIQEIYALARESFFGGQKSFQLQAFPFRMTALNMAKHRNNPNFAFWKMLKEGYDHFDATHQEPKVAVCEKRYVFDAAASDDSTKALSFNAKAACPVYQLDKTVADAVLEHRRQEQFKMAEYIASGVSTVPPRNGIDGGMNPAFADKLGTQEGYDSKGRLIQVATAPGSLPRTANKAAPAPIVSVPETTPQPESPRVVLASVPMPRPAPLPKQGEAPASQRPTSIAGLIGNLFGGSKAEAATSTPSAENNQPATRNASTDLAAKPKRPAPVQTPTPAPVHTASAAPAPKSREVAPAPAPENVSRPAVKPSVQQTAKAEAPRTQDSEIRTAYSTPPASNNGLLSGAQPVVPAGTFNSFR
ncbi:MAG TPA: L,D-transpeptidase family protein [Pseudolabrys sp.]